jgi:hypothetical protein
MTFGNFSIFEIPRGLYENDAPDAPMPQLFTPRNLPKYLFSLLLTNYTKIGLGYWDIMSSKCHHSGALGHRGHDFS